MVGNQTASYSRFLETRRYHCQPAPPAPNECWPAPPARWFGVLSTTVILDVCARGPQHRGHSVHSMAFMASSWTRVLINAVTSVSALCPLGLWGLLNRLSVCVVCHFCCRFCSHINIVSSAESPVAGEVAGIVVRIRWLLTRVLWTSFAPIPALAANMENRGAARGLRQS